MNYSEFGIDGFNKPVNYRKLQERLCVESSRLIRQSYVSSPEVAKELVKQSHKLDKAIRAIQDMMDKNVY